MKKDLYCHICGKVLAAEETHQLIEQEYKSRKRKLMFEICPDCLKELKHKDISRPKISLTKEETQYLKRDCEITSEIAKRLIFKNTYLMFNTLSDYYKLMNGYDVPDFLTMKIPNFALVDRYFLSKMAERFIKLEKELVYSGQKVSLTIHDIERNYTRHEVNKTYKKFIKYLDIVKKIINQF